MKYKVTLTFEPDRKKPGFLNWGTLTHSVTVTSTNQDEAQEKAVSISASIIGCDPLNGSWIVNDVVKQEEENTNEYQSYFTPSERSVLNSSDYTAYTVSVAPDLNTNPLYTSSMDLPPYTYAVPLSGETSSADGGGDESGNQVTQPVATSYVQYPTDGEAWESHSENLSGREDERSEDEDWSEDYVPYGAPSSQSQTSSNPSSGYTSYSSTKIEPEIKTATSSQLAGYTTFHDIPDSLKASCSYNKSLPNGYVSYRPWIVAVSPGQKIIA